MVTLHKPAVAEWWSMVVGYNHSLRGQWPSPREPTRNLVSNTTVEDGVLGIGLFVTAAGGCAVL